MTILNPEEDDPEQKVQCAKCQQVLSRHLLDKHDSAVHGQSLTDAEGCCKMCGEPADDPAQHLREECGAR